MNIAPSTQPRAARRTSCLGTFVLVVVLWSLSVVAWPPTWSLDR